MMPTPLMWTSASIGTMTSTLPIMANALIVTCCPANRASRRSSVPPPQKATAVMSSGGVHAPLRRKPPMTAIASRGPVPGAGRVVGAAFCGRSRVIGSRSP
jgi:hypothetical protein